MIIRRLQAENILKFTHLDVAFPQRGNILISGDNESGKSAIIETICLGLFGRTANLDYDQTPKVIHWGDARGWISLDFTGSDGQNLTVYRHFSRQDPPQARLNAEGVEDPIARGEGEVNAAIAQAIGMEFDQFIETIYLSQGAPEGEDPEGIVRMVAGVEELELLSSQLDSEIKMGREQVNRIATELTHASQELTALNLQPGLLEQKRAKLAELLGRKSALEGEVSNRTQQLNGLTSGYKTATSSFSATLQQGKQASLAAWNQNLKNLQSALAGLAPLNLGEASAIVARLREKTQRTLESLQSFNAIVDKSIQDGKSRSHWLSGTDAQSMAGEQQALAEADVIASRQRGRGFFQFLLFLILAVPVGGIGVILSFYSKDPQFTLLATTAAKLVPDLEPVYLQAAMGVGGLFLLISLLGLGKIIKNIALKSQYAQARQVLEDRAEEEKKIVAIIAETAQLPLCQQIARLSGLGDQVPWSENLQQWQQSQGSNLVDEASLSALLNDWNSDFGRLNQILEAMLRALDDEQRQANDQINTLTATLSGLQQEIQHEQERKDRDQALRERSQSLKENRTQTAHGIDVRMLAQQLIQGASQEIAIGFSIELRRLIAKTAPLFTRGRYQHLRIDENLNLSAFSPVKNDFVDFSETSRGLRRQLMLSLRLALAQALTARANARSQFLILDEPFVHYDHDRFRESFHALGNISDVIQQIFVVNQSFDADLIESAACHLHCNIDQDVLEVASPEVAG
ncbi:MAG: AAA family ATPase [Magnetococcales bacterium]|nr:AAA family ATPase [Magnetococcales bacterium]